MQAQSLSPNLIGEGAFAMLPHEALVEIEKVLSHDELVDFAKALDGVYDVFMLDPKVWYFIESISPPQALPLVCELKEGLVGHSLVSQILMKYYPSEKVIKYNFVVEELKHKKDDVALFEYSINQSRIDIGRINGQSFCYEIKTEFDNLYKLEKQLKDYLKAFEYVFVILDSKHLGKVAIPDVCGAFEIVINDEKQISFEKIKDADLSPYLDYETQLNNLSSEEMKFILKKVECDKIPNLKSDRAELIKDTCNKQQLNYLFKEAIKNKYKDNWKFLLDNFDRIEPVDIQAFYRSMADPYWVYYKNSSIVCR